MTLAQACPDAQRKPSPSRLLNAPLAELLDEYGVTVTALEAGPGFTGGTYVREDGTLLFVKPAGRPDAEWELMARAMLGAVLRVPLPPLPEPYQLSEVPAPRG
ncbi:hypothetical protein OIE75_29525 [Streptomyces sp. NBC_01723]|uniref:hypothetical protein n=1 Tax=Streptomyces sp. NBC_01723 TaxID=2975921 RepID=UPI002E381516|nr:hypothetical protein [Streptomyces sp. NBC_01723]